MSKLEAAEDKAKGIHQGPIESFLVTLSRKELTTVFDVLDAEKLKLKEDEAKVKDTEDDAKALFDDLSRQHKLIEPGHPLRD